jgi:hypothetical protein
MKFIIRTILIIIILAILCLAVSLVYMFTGQAEPADRIDFGVSFSQYFAEKMEIDWQKMYLAILDDLKVEKIRLVAYWPNIEPELGEYSFEDLDWQILEAGKRNVQVILVVGQKVPRWPECHIPKWATELSQEKKQQEILLMLSEVINRYQGNETIWAWQVENEPFLKSFGECPKLNKDFLDEEIALVRESDLGKRPIILTASGELSSWVQPASRANILGTTLYRIVWSDLLEKHFRYPIPPVFYYKRAQLTKLLTGIDRVIIIELQAEPWSHRMIYETSPEEQSKSMDLEKFKRIIEYTRQTGFDEAYLWGAEWWYWLKEKHNDNSLWQEAKKLWLVETIEGEI